MRQESATPSSIGSNVISATLPYAVQTGILSDLHARPPYVNWTMPPIEATTLPGTHIRQSDLDQTISYGSLPQDYSQGMQLQCWEHGCNGLHKDLCRDRKIKCRRLGNGPYEQCSLLGRDCDFSNTRVTVPSRPNDIASSGANVNSPGDVHATNLFTPNNVFPPDMLQTPMQSPASFSAESPNVSGSKYGPDSIAKIEPLILPGVDQSIFNTVPNIT
ncbi:hypothetical protein QBC46DRAFT_397340 [Diplogelasinospora grovesii]|uniref:Uncharacterized protein n=1 Tax=Diplogelasinospora grovesii TaxID=303347 RepID=A0AAN6MYN5_9PEZI|nr:hypothetical protein QBC46DRAFT_397340 [Diplogelasinospora grovesii]